MPHQPSLLPPHRHQIFPDGCVLKYENYNSYKELTTLLSLGILWIAPQNWVSIRIRISRSLRIRFSRFNQRYPTYWSKMALTLGSISSNRRSPPIHVEVDRQRHELQVKIFFLHSSLRQFNILKTIWKLKTVTIPTK